VFLRHADALSLANAAEKKRTELMTLVEEYKRDESMDSKLYSLAAQAKFGFEQALQSWNACPIAQKGLRSISILMIERSIRVGDLERARVMIDELSEPNEQLERLFLLQQEEVRAEEKKIQILDRLAENLNPQISFDTRFWIQASLSTSILIVIVLLKLVGFQFGTAHTHERMLHTILLVFLPSWLVILYHYKRIMQNAFGRQALRTVALGSFGFVLERIMVYKGEIPIATAYSLDIIIVSLALANAAPAIRLGPKLSIGGLFLGGLSIIFSDYSEHFMYFVTVSVAVIISWDWHSEGKEGKRKENLYQ
jgi:hypothetical protein